MNLNSTSAHRAPWTSWVRGFTVALSLALASVVLASEPCAAQREDRDLALDVGEQTILSAEGVESYSMGAGGVFDVRVPDDQSSLIILGVAAGNSTLLVIYAGGRQVTYTITVTDPDAVETRVGAVEERENIRLDLYYVELSESAGYKIGLGWPAVIGGPNVGLGNVQIDFVDSGLANPPLATATASLVNQVLPRLDLAQSSGWARVRRRAALITQNGSRASFQSGGEVNVLVTGSLAAEIRQITFGSNLSFIANYDDESRRLQLEVKVEVSELTNDRGTGVPGRSVSVVNTQVNLELGQAIMLAGISAETETRGRSGLPGLSQIPFLGALFGTHDRRAERVENVLFVVPTVVDNVEAGARRRIDAALEAFSGYEGDVPGAFIAEESERPAAPTRRRRRRRRSDD